MHTRTWLHSTNGNGLQILTGVSCPMLVGFVLIPLRIRVLLFSWCHLIWGNSKCDGKGPGNSLTVPSSFFSFALGSNTSTDPGATHTQDAPPCSWCFWLLQNDLHLPQHRGGAEHHPTLAERLSDSARHIVWCGGGVDRLNGLSVWDFSLDPNGTPERGAAPNIIYGLLRQRHLQLDHLPWGETPLHFVIIVLKTRFSASSISRWGNMKLGGKQLGLPGKCCVAVRFPIVGLILGLRYVEFPRALGPVLWGEDVECGAL